MDRCFIDKIKGILFVIVIATTLWIAISLRSRRAEHVTIDISKIENKIGVGVITQ
jgi:hypothetical protein